MKEYFVEIGGKERKIVSHDDDIKAKARASTTSNDGYTKLRRFMFIYICMYFD